VTREPPFHWVWSDTHFGHANVIKYSERPFASADEMDAALIAGHNAVVGPSQTVLWVGDVSFHGLDRTREILAALHGRKILVRGNHDRSAAQMARLGFDLVADALTLNLDGRLVRVSHLPYRGMDSREVATRSEGDSRREKGLPVWERRGADEWLLHGHTHSRVKRSGQAIHVGVDAWGYRPASVAWIAEMMRTAPPPAQGDGEPGAKGGG
jgi:calcineurin-like phosphoesterase family protein